MPNNTNGISFINVVDEFGAKADGSSDDTAALQAAFDAAFGSGMAKRRVILPPGNYIVRGGGLTGKNWFGGCVQGSGRFSTMIQNVDGGPVISTNGCQYMRFEDMRLDGNNGGHTIFDLDWDGTGTALQSNTFENLYFSNGSVGMMIAKSGFMGSENLFQNCFFSNMSSRGLQVVGYNALQQTIVGGDFQACMGVGVNVNTGAANVISGVGFQQNGWDIQTDGASNNTMVVSGCRTESPNFINNAGGQSMAIAGCHQTSAGGRGLFYTGRGGVIDMRGCLFDGQVNPQYWTRLCIQACNPVGEAVNGDWLVKDVGNWWWTPNNRVALSIEIENIIDLAGAAYAAVDKQRLFTTDGKTVTMQNYTVS